MFNRGEIKFISLTDANKMLQIRDEGNNLYKGKWERRINLNDSIIMVLSSIEYNKRIISRTLMHREVFLFYEELLKPLGLSEGAIEAGFFPYKYGPYSIDVNLALSTLIVSGIVCVTNYYDEPIEKVVPKENEIETFKKRKKNKFLTVFSTGENFDYVGSKYDELLNEKGFTVKHFQEMISEKKQAWDQSTAKGIAKLLLSKGFKEWSEKKSLEEVYSSINFGKITEEYRPRVKF